MAKIPKAKKRQRAKLILKPHIDGYQAAMDKGWRYERKYWKKVCREFHARIDWRTQDHEEPVVREWDESNTIEEETLSPELEVQRATRVDGLNRRIRRWFVYRVRKLCKHQRSSGLDPLKDPYAILLAKLSGLTSPPKARQAYQQFMREAYTDKIAPAVAREWQVELANRHESGQIGEEDVKEPKAGFRAAVARKLFASLSTAEREGYASRAKAEAATAKSEYVQALKDPFSKAPEARQRCINGLSEFVAPILRGINGATGLHATLVVGGPIPEFGGELRTIHLSYGQNRTAAADHWPQWDKNRFSENVSQFMIEYLKTAYTSEDCARSALGQTVDLDSAQYTIDGRTPESDSDSDSDDSESDSDSDDETDDDRPQKKKRKVTGKEDRARRTQSENTDPSSSTVIPVESQTKATKRPRPRPLTDTNVNKTASASAADSSPPSDVSPPAQSHDDGPPSQPVSEAPPAPAPSPSLPPSAPPPSSPFGGAASPEHIDDITVDEGAAPTSTLPGNGWFLSEKERLENLERNRLIFQQLKDQFAAKTGAWALAGCPRRTKPAEPLRRSSRHVPTAGGEGMEVDGTGMGLGAASGSHGKSYAGDLANRGAGGSGGESEPGTSPSQPAPPPSQTAPPPSQTAPPPSQTAPSSETAPPPSQTAPSSETAPPPSPTAPPPETAAPPSQGVPPPSQAAKRAMGPVTVVPDTSHTSDMHAYVACPARAPKWFVDAHALMTAEDLDCHYRAVVAAWTRMEEVSRFERGPTNLPHKLRPQQVSTWITRNRRDAPPPVQNPAEYAAIWQAWWDSLQPSWRVRDEDGQWSTTSGYGQGGREWGPLYHWGVNGVLSIVASLYCWGQAVREDHDMRVVWEAAVCDVVWILEGMATYYEMFKGKF
ncbi:hypothetical protein R3P38DRAFT_3218926 [Favolaschia claudopus]|uniref:Uncharacterized protein n=1 Tax=Favolaschia claudopus TaxID=2862362 RepID=A0AAW0A3J9_9AGAR